MYKVIHNGKHLAEWKKKLPLQAEVLEKSEVIKKTATTVGLLF